MNLNLATIIGLEIHVELKTKSKMFCDCKNEPDEKQPNTNICPICLAHPGTLPVPNRSAISATVKIGKALDCKIRKLSKFDRKHYFYPDLPKGYQISQYDEPIAEHGQLIIEFPLEANPRDSAIIHIRRVHLEEDTAKLYHNNNDTTLVDFNRAGTPLVEIVTEPDFESALEAKTFAQELQTILRYLGVSDADMEKGHMRVEANISVQEAGRFEIVEGVVRPLGDYELKNKVEVKNINSFRAVEKAIEFETRRQTELLKKRKLWPQETRGWNENLGETVSQRAKENADDYRYFPEPDIPPFHPEQIAGAISLPELPAARRARFLDEYGFSYSDARILTADKNLANYTDAVMSELVQWLASLPETADETDDIKEKKRNKLARVAGGWLTSKLLGIMNERKIDIRLLKIKPENFAELIAIIYTNRVNSTNGYKLLIDMLDANTDADPTHIMEEKGYGQINDETQLQGALLEVIKNYPAQVAQYQGGKEAVFNFLKGMVMKATEGSADPSAIERLLKKELKK